MNNNELKHYGVPGMKWGVRRKLDAAKEEYKKSKKEYNEAYNKAYSKNYQSFSLSKKKRQASTERWDDAAKKAQRLNEVEQRYKQAKKDFKADKKAKQAVEKALQKAEKQKYKDYIKKRSKEILAGESVIGKIYDVYTGAHKIQADLEYDELKKKGRI